MIAINVLTRDLIKTVFDYETFRYLISFGYFSNEETTASTLDSDGWLRTGDPCYFDEDGFNGCQVPQAELEALTHPEITDAAVLPFPDEKEGQLPMAYVVRETGSSISESAVMDFVDEQVAPYKRIRRVAFTASIPKNPSGKILRKDTINLAVSKL